jgi:hypothetical protein
MDSSLNARKSLAKEAGIKDYIGLSFQNGQLMDYLIVKFLRENNCLST